MLDIFRSNKLEVLVGVLASRIGESESMPADPFAPLRVVVGSKGMERWLRHQLASALPGHICTNMAFPFPQQVLSEALIRLEDGPDDAESTPDPWSTEALTWCLLEVLPELLRSAGARTALQALHDYLGEEIDGPVTPRALALAGQLADVFDRLVIYRPELAVKWSMGSQSLPKGAEDLGWLPPLWLATHQRLSQADGGGAHGAMRWQKLMSDGKPAAAPFDQPLRIFGIAALPPSFLHQLAWLSSHEDVEVELYVVCPSNAYWADLHGLGRGAVGELLQHDRDHLGERMSELPMQRLHPLLQSLGRVGRDMQLVLEDVGYGLDAFADTAPQLGSDMGERPRSALHVLQSDILHLRDPMSFEAEERAERLLVPAEDSVQIHACYGPTRQVEVLREALLHLFEAHPDLEPRDVLVMVPDIEAYVPLIGAVFDQGRERPLVRDGQPLRSESERWGKAGAPHIPYAITERSLRRTNPVAEVLLRVLELASDQARVSSVTVLDLLALEPFRLRFGIDHDDIETLTRWVEQSGIRWGIDPSDRSARFGQPAVSQNTWRFGLERLALGVTMADAPGRLWDRPPRLAQPSAERALGVVPHDGLEGGLVHLLGRFFDACTTLFDELDRLRGERDGRGIAGWLSVLMGDPEQPAESVAGLGTLGRLTATSPKASWLTARVRTEVEALRQAAAPAKPIRSITMQAFHALLSSRFEVASGATSAHTGAVTFAAMAPYRSVPYRVICLLGMDEGAFPRASSRRRFDPTQRAPRAGDRDSRDEDRYLLLEALLAARDHVLVLYTGRDPRTNERRAPAVPVGELLDVVDATFSTPDGQPARAHISKDHPLQPFSLDCFDTDKGKSRAWSYDQGLLGSAIEVMQRQPAQLERFFPPTSAPAPPPVPPLAKDDKPVREITISDLEWFFRNPTKSLLTRGLHLYLPKDEEPTPHREPIEPDSLDRWGWCRRLLDQRWGQLERAWDPSPAHRQGDADPLERLGAEGLLPLGTAGEDWAAAPLALVDAMMARAAAWFEDERAPTAPRIEPIELELELPACVVRLVGSTGPIWKGDQLQLGIGDIYKKGKYRVGAWLRHLAWVASTDDAAPRTVLLSGRLKLNGTVESQAGSMVLKVADDDVASACARRLLCDAVAIYLHGREQPIPLFPGSSFTFAEKSVFKGARVFDTTHLGRPLDDLEPGLAGKLGAAAAAALSSFGHGERDYDRGDLDDEYTARVWSGLDPIGSGVAEDSPLQRYFALLALAVWQDCLLGWKREYKTPTIAPREEPAGGDA